MEYQELITLCKKAIEANNDNIYLIVPHANPLTGLTKSLLPKNRGPRGEIINDIHGECLARYSAKKVLAYIMKFETNGGE